MMSDSEVEVVRPRLSREAFGMLENWRTQPGEPRSYRVYSCYFDSVAVHAARPCPIGGRFKDFLAMGTTVISAQQIASSAVDVCVSKVKDLLSDVDRDAENGGRS